jgi:hypothetical protein
MREDLNATQPTSPVDRDAAAASIPNGEPAHTHPLHQDGGDDLIEPSLADRYEVGKSQNCPIDVFPFLQRNSDDPAVKVCQLYTCG